MNLNKLILVCLFIVATTCLGVASALSQVRFASKRMFNTASSSEDNDATPLIIGHNKRIPFRPPSMHPYETTQELNRVREQDPYSFSTEHYKHSEVYTRALLEQEVSSSSNVLRSVRKILVEGVDYVSMSDHENYIQDGSLHSYSFEANMLSGVAFLDQDESVWDVSCLDGAIHVDFSNGHTTARQWIPGTRLVVGKKWNCFGSQTRDVYGREDQASFLVLSRSIIGTEGQMLKIKFNVRPLKNNELFVNGGVTYRSIPVARESEHNFTSIVNTNDHNKNTRYSWTRRLHAVGFNYDTNTGAVKDAVFPLHTAGDFKVVCENCYAYLNAEFRIEFEWTWTAITKAQVLVGGKIESDATLKASLSKSISYSKGGVLATLPPINFMFFVYGVPIWVDITPKLAYSFDCQASGTLEYSRNFKASYEQYIGYQYTSNNGFSPFRQGAGFQWSSHSPGLRVQVSATAEFSLYPQFDVTIWSLVTTTISIKPKLIALLEVTGLATSLSEYGLFASVSTSYKVDVSIKNELMSFEREINVWPKTTIPSLSGTYSLQSSSFKAVESSSFYSTGNALPTLSSATLASSFYLDIVIAPSDRHYFIDYAYGISAPPQRYTSSTNSRNCKSGCLTRFYPYAYVAIKVVEDGWFSNTVVFQSTLDLRSYLTNNPTSSVTIQQSGIVSVVLRVTQRTVTFKETPSNRFIMDVPTTFIFDKESFSFLDSNFIAFESDRAIYISPNPYVFNSVFENGLYYYFSNNAPNNFTLTASYATIKFINTMAYKNVPQFHPLSLTTNVIRDNRNLNNFIQVVSNEKSNRYAVTVQTRGSFDILIYEAWMVKYNIFQTKGKRYKYVETQTGNIESMQLRTHHFNVSLENSYGNVQQKSQMIVAQLVPIGELIISSIRLDPYLEHSSSSSVNSRVLVEQEPLTESLYPYLQISAERTTTVSITDSLIDSLTMNNGLYSLNGIAKTTIPIPSTFKKFYISPNRINGDVLSINVIQNFKLLNGVPSIVKRLGSGEMGTFAVPCSSIAEWHSGFIRILDSLNGKILSVDQVSARVIKKNAEILSDLQVTLISDGAFIISSMQSINTYCKSDTANRYVQITVSSTQSTTRQLQLEYSQTIDYSKVNTRSTNQLTIDPNTNGYMYIDINKERNSYELKGIKGFVFSVTTLDDCNIDLYINKKGQLATPTFSDSSSIFASSARLSLKGEKMSVSLLNDCGSIIMMYSDNTCRFTMSTEELKSTQLSLRFIESGEPKTFKSSFSSNETTLIHVKIEDENHAWDRNFTTTLQTPNQIFNLFKSSLDLTNYFSTVNFIVLNGQTLSFEFVPKLDSQLENIKKTTLSFNSVSTMFESRYDILPSNQLFVGDIPDQPSNSTIKDNGSTSSGFSLTFLTLLISLVGLFIV